MLARFLDRAQPSSSPLPTQQHPPPPPPPPVSTMKDTSSLAAAKGARQTAYPKKRPSPAVRDGGITKRKSPATAAAAGIRTKTVEMSAARRLQLRLVHEKMLLEEEYRSEIRRYMHDMELATMSNPQSMDQQPEIKWTMRPCLVDFILETHFFFRLRPETLYLTLNIVDRYVSRRVVYTKHYQLVGCTALWIASKFEDAKDRVPSVDQLAHLCHDTYETTAFIQMEIHVLQTIQWVVGHPTAEAWLRTVCCGSSVEDDRTQHIARFLMEISLFFREYLAYPSSAIASGALCLARHIMGKTRRPQNESAFALEVVDLIDDLLASRAYVLSETLVKKYSYDYYSKASSFVLGYYLKGGRFEHQPLPTCPPITPMSASMLTPRTPTSASSTRSSVLSSGSSDTDDMPITPGSPTFGSDPFVLVAQSASDKASDKENLPLVEANGAKRMGDFVELPAIGPIARMALLEINGMSSSPAVAR